MRWAGKCGGLSIKLTHPELLGNPRVKPAFEASLKRLQIDYVDLYLIHTPFAFRPGDEQNPGDEKGKVLCNSGKGTQRFEPLSSCKDCSASAALS